MRAIIFSLLLVMAVLIVIPPQTAHAQNSGAIQQLLDNADYWRQRGRTDKMAEAYEKILRSDPKHATALAELALFYAREGDKDKAEKYLKRLKAAHPGHPQIGGIEQAIGVGSDYKGLLAQARQLVKEGNTQAAVAKYRQAFGNQPPSGALGLEFYQTLGGTPGGWDEARQGLERLARQNSGKTYQLAYAMHLTYREKTRRDGIVMLEKLADDSKAGKKAAAAWRQALLWLGASARDAGLFQAYLKAQGEDAEIRKRLDEISAGRTVRAKAEPNLGEGFQALEDEDIEKADSVFTWALKQQGRSVDAIVGMGLVAMQKEEFERAVKLFEEAKRLAPDKPEMWQQSLVSARFWLTVREAEAKVDEGKFKEAETLYLQAIGLSPGEALHAEMQLGNLYMRTNRDEEAAEMIRRVLEKDPNYVPALRAMVQLMLKLGQTEAALVFNDRLAKLDETAAWDPQHIKSETLRSQAAFERRLGDIDRARELLELALETDPENTWVLFDMVTLYMEAGEIPKARTVMDRLLTIDAEKPQFRVLQARLYYEEGDFKRAMEVINSTPKNLITPELERFRKRLEVEAKARQAVQRGAYENKPTLARYALIELEREVGSDPELIAIVAMAWADMGDYAQAMKMMRAAANSAVGNDTGIRLQLAAVLLRAGYYDEFVEVIESLRNDPKLSARERRDLKNLRVAYGVRRADRYREQENYTGAYTVLTPLLKEYQDDPRLMAALGRVLFSAGYHRDAEAVFVRILKDNPRDIEARQGAIFTSLKQGNKRRAEMLLKEGIAQSPDDPRMHLLAARVSRMIGDDARAMTSLQRALALEEKRRQAEGSGGFEPGASTMFVDATYEQIIYTANRRLQDGSADGETMAPAGDNSLHSEILAEMEDIKRQYRSHLRFGGNIRYRMGQSGLGQLLDIQAPVLASIPTGYKGRVEFGVTAVFLDAGELQYSDATATERFGTYGLLTADQRPGTDSLGQNAAGAELYLGYRYRGYGIWVGSTPLGFPVMTAEGGFQLGDQFNVFGFRIVGHRMAVKDSLLSWAGTEDPVSGKTWGAVTKNGGRLDLSLDFSPVLYYIYGGYDFFIGSDVKLNHGFNAGTGLQWTLYDSDVMRWVTGIQGNTMGYMENLRYFSFGHGGYFSPQLFISGAVPIIFSGKKDKISWNLQADVGINWFRENDADYYPTLRGEQAAREAMTDGDGQALESFYPGDSKLSFAFNLDLQVAYQIIPSLAAGLNTALHTAKDYREFMGGIFLQYTFGTGASAQGGAIGADAPPAGLIPGQ